MGGGEPRNAGTAATATPERVDASAMPMTTTNAEAATPARRSDQRGRPPARGGSGGPTTPLSSAHDAANDRGSNAPLPSTASAEAPSASASSRSAFRSAAISLATGSGTRRRRHSRRHSSTKSFTFTLLPPFRQDRARRRRHHAPTATPTRPPRAPSGPPAMPGNTSAEARRYWRRDTSPRGLHAPTGRAADRSSPRRRSTDRGRQGAWSSRSRTQAPPPSPREGRGRAPREGTESGDSHRLPCSAR